MNILSLIILIHLVTPTLSFIEFFFHFSLSLDNRVYKSEIPCTKDKNGTQCF